MIYLKNLAYILRHKWYVFLAACRLGIPWLGLIHDLSKFLPDEFIPYARYFYGAKPVDRPSTGYFKPLDTGDAAFDLASLRHYRRNLHHWQSWLIPNGNEIMRSLPMPERYMLEMLADWDGAALAQGRKPNTPEWYAANREKMQLHPDTRKWIEKHLEGGKA